jgi:hypothetical protein
MDTDAELIGNMTRREYRQLLRGLRRIVDGKLLRGLSQLEAEKLESMLAPFGWYWWRLYEYPLDVHLAVAMRLQGIEEDYTKAAIGQNVERTVLEYLFAEAESCAPITIGEIDPRMVSLLFNALTALRYSLNSVSYFGMTINELVAKARTGDHASLRKAASIDKTVLFTAVGQASIANWQLSDDVSALAELLGAIEPPKKRRKYREFRFMAYVLEAAGALDRGVTRQVIELIVGDLQLHTEAGGDAPKNVRDLFRVILKK